MKVWIILFILSVQNLAFASAKYPLISTVTGKVSVFDKLNKIVLIKKGTILKEKALIKTEMGSQIRIELDENSAVILFENSNLEFPVIGFDQGEVLDVILQKGKLRVQTSLDSERYYVTPLTRDIYKNSDFLLEYDPAKAQTQITVFSGRIEFRGLENEKSLQLSSGEAALFHGVLENGEPVYDVLLKGRKVARGEASNQPIQIKKEELERLSQQLHIQKQVVKKDPKFIKKPGQICEQPYAKLNECIWKQVKDKCYRYRCNANGRWSDEFLLPQAGDTCCQKAPVVGPCDY